MTDGVARSAAAAFGAGVLCVAGHEAGAAEPRIVPQVCAACPPPGPNFIAVPGSRTCVRITGRVVADADLGGQRLAGGPGRERVLGPAMHGQIRVEAKTETDLGDVTLIYQTEDPRRRPLGR